MTVAVRASSCPDRHIICAPLNGIVKVAMGFSLHLSDVADEKVRLAIAAPLARFNESQAGPSGNRPLVIELRDADGAVVGGLWGATAYGWLFTQLLVVPEQSRGQGLGRKLLSMAEAEAMKRGCHAAWLDTFEFQAKAFYEGMGYSCFAALPDYPKGSSRYFMRKDLGHDEA
jgi:GNAT superfamily N-acetyltransferase